MSKIEKSYIFKELNERRKILENLGYNVLFVGLYGSQNYNLDDNSSDIDVRAVVMPTLEQIVNREKISKKIVCDNGDIDVKDILTYYQVVQKGNIGFIEPIHTDYFIGDKYLQKLFKKMPVNLKSIIGMMYEKKKAFKHMYPSKAKEFSLWGYDPKQVHHIVRLSHIMNEYKNDLFAINNKCYLSYYDENKTNMLNIKRNNGKICDSFDDKTIDGIIAETKKIIPEDYKFEKVNIDKEINGYIINKIKLELFNNSEVHFARSVRTFGGDIPKSDFNKFSVLRKSEGNDIGYIVYESIEILHNIE